MSLPFLAQYFESRVWIHAQFQELLAERVVPQSTQPQEMCKVHV